MKKFKRIFLIVLDSVGIGHAKDAEKFGDISTANTLVNIDNSTDGLHLNALESIGLGRLDTFKYIKSENALPSSYSFRLSESSNGKDTLTGHLEMMGIQTNEPFKTFFETGFPKELIDELEKQTGYKVMGNCAASGTQIIKDLGERQLKTKELIVYTSTDSVLQIAAHEELYGLDEIYRVCKIARQITMKPEWKVGRVIARPFLGKDANSFYRTRNRHDYALDPSGCTALNMLREHNYATIAIGKINDIFNGNGISESQKIVNNDDGMDKIIEIAAHKSFEGLLFANLVDFDMEFGHRRDIVGYKNALEQFDKRLSELLKVLTDDDLLIITADHGNDPTQKGSDHTRENVPALLYSKSFKNGSYMGEESSFMFLGAFILENFNIKQKYYKLDNLLEKLL